MFSYRCQKEIPMFSIEKEPQSAQPQLISWFLQNNGHSNIYIHTYINDLNNDAYKCNVMLACLALFAYSSFHSMTYDSSQRTLYLFLLRGYTHLLFIFSLSDKLRYDKATKWGDVLYMRVRGRWCYYSTCMWWMLVLVLAVDVPFIQSFLTCFLANRYIARSNECDV